MCMRFILSWRQPVLGLWLIAMGSKIGMAQPVQLCDKIQSPKELLTCTAANRMETLVQLEEVETTKFLEGIATQRPNPEIDSELWTRDTDGEPSVELTFKWLHTLLRGGKLEARKDVALAKHQLAKQQFEFTLMENTRETIIEMYNLVRLQEEISDLKEMIGSYDRIVKAYRERQALSPEARISVQVFTIAQHEAGARLRQKKDEVAARQAIFEKIGIPLDQITKFLPSKWPNWPKLEKKELKPLESSPISNIRKALVALSEAELDIEKSESYQDIKIGPMASLDRSQNEQTWGVGVALSMNIPVYNRNEAGIKYAAEKLQSQKTLLERFQLQLDRDYRAFIGRYETLRREIDQLPTDEWLKKAHQQLEAEISRGLIDASLIIEGHEQHLNIIERRNELRMRLLEALTGVYFLDGHEITEILR
ncbi:MAG: TolC family protein [Oligoflexus sp.]